ncbi:polyprenyl diphosphate synthase [Chloroflexota bacterium]
MKSRAQTPEEEICLPDHVAIIMDGNGRWAGQRGLSRLAGHIAGLDRARTTIKYLNSKHLKYLTLFGFSTENWSRPQDEVSNILRVFTEIIDQEALAFHELGIRLRHLGRLAELPPSLQESITRAIELTKDNTGMTFNLAFNYGGRAEILDAVRQIMAKNIPPQDIDEALFSNYLYNADIPDVDLLIRTGGELRISNFLVWQSVYSEYYFTDVFWPDFDEKEIDKALESYRQRQRRFGGI